MAVDSVSPVTDLHGPRELCAFSFQQATCAYFGTAYCCVHSLAVAIAACSFSFQLLATSAASGSSGLGAPSRAWMERRIVRIWRAGDQLSTNCVSFVSSSILPTRSDRCMRPTLQHIETDATKLVHIWVEDLGEETDFGWSHGIVVGEEKFELEDTACDNAWLVICSFSCTLFFFLNRSGCSTFIGG